MKAVCPNLRRVCLARALGAPDRDACARQGLVGTVRIGNKLAVRGRSMSPVVDRDQVVQPSERRAPVERRPSNPLGHAKPRDCRDCAPGKQTGPMTRGSTDRYVCISQNETTGAVDSSGADKAMAVRLVTPPRAPRASARGRRRQLRPRLARTGRRPVVVAIPGLASISRSCDRLTLQTDPCQS